MAFVFGDPSDDPTSKRVPFVEFIKSRKAKPSAPVAQARAEVTRAAQTLAQAVDALMRVSDASHAGGYLQAALAAEPSVAGRLGLKRD